MEDYAKKIYDVRPHLMRNVSAQGQFSIVANMAYAMGPTFLRTLYSLPHCVECLSSKQE